MSNGRGDGLAETPIQPGELVLWPGRGRVYVERIDTYVVRFDPGDGTRSKEYAVRARHLVRTTNNGWADAAAGPNPRKRRRSCTPSAAPESFMDPHSNDHGSTTMRATS
jgi:hypothetical protein